MQIWIKLTNLDNQPYWVRVDSIVGLNISPNGTVYVKLVGGHSTAVTEGAEQIMDAITEALRQYELGAL